MKLQLKRMTLLNFKGIRSKTIEFGQVTDILGTNGSGKTTLKDAFLWLFFGKDSSDRKDFEIKTLDENNQPLHELSHEVSAELDVDGVLIDIRRVYAEKWTKKRGSTTREFTGHETTFYWNDVPVSEKEYVTKINALVNENVFRLVTNTDFFNSLKWQDRRNTLLAMAGDISNDEILDRISNSSNKQQVAQLAAAISQGKTVDEYRREIAAKKKKIKDELDVIPSRIDEVKRAIATELPAAIAESTIQELKDSLVTIDGLLTNKSKALQQAIEDRNQNLTVWNNEKQSLMTRRNDIQFEVKNAVKDAKTAREMGIADLRRDIRTKENDLSQLINDRSLLQRNRQQDEKARQQLIQKWTETNSQTVQFDESQFCCPACNRPYDDADLGAARSSAELNFNQKKSEALASITAEGSRLKTAIETYDMKIAGATSDIEEVEKAIAGLKEKLAEMEKANNRLSQEEDRQAEESLLSHAEYVNAGKRIVELTELLNQPFAQETNADLLERRKSLTSQLEELNKAVINRDALVKQVKTSEIRLEELKQVEEKLSQELADFEGIEFSIQEYTKAKMDTLERRINGMFSFVRFKMFEEQINGGQVETCTTLINGVPYTDANTASKVHAGLDIINAISDYYDIQAPVWIDNRESVIHLPDTDLQIINLKVNETVPNLKVIHHGELAIA